MSSGRPGISQKVQQLIEDQLDGYSLDQRFYTDPEIYQLELERIIDRNWVLAGHHSELPNPGDYKVFSVAHESAIIVRSNAGVIQAFANVCRHRGSQLCLETAGNTRAFTCIYHGWKYDTDGALVAARDMPDEFDRKMHPLHRLSVELVHGMILICFSDSPPSVDNCRQDLAEPMAMLGFDRLKVAAYKQYAIAANWKLSIENYQECYHCATAHPEYARIHTLMLDQKRRSRVQGRMLENMAACGLREINIDYIDTAARSGEIGYGYSRTALFDGCASGGKDGKPVAPLLGDIKDYDGGASDISLGAFSFLLAYSDHVVCYAFTPVDLDNSKVDLYWLVRDDANEGEDYDVDALTWLWDLTIKADRDIIVNNARGIRSKFYQPGPFSGMECAERNYVKWLLQELARR